jgi:hypothetical protein
MKLFGAAFLNVKRSFKVLHVVLPLLIWIMVHNRAPDKECA